MFNYTLRRLFFTIPTLLFISLIIFLLLDLAPNDPTGNLPLTIPPAVREQIRLSLGLGQPIQIRYYHWLVQFFINEPLNLLSVWCTDHPSFANVFSPVCNSSIVDDPSRLRILSFATRSPVVDLIVERMPQTLWVVGLSYVVGVLIAVPIGVYSAYKQYSWFDQLGTFTSMIGFSVPTFFTGVLMIVIFSVSLHWFPSIYNTTLKVTNWSSFLAQLRQMAMPVFVLALYNAAQISRFMRASMLDNLNQDYVRTARAKGLSENVVVLVHVLRNSMIPVVTVIALGVPQVFGGAIINEQVFKVNGLGQLLIIGIQGADIPLVQTLTFIFAVLIVMFNLIADLLYGILDPRIRYV